MARITDIPGRVTTIVDICLDGPEVIPEISDMAEALVAYYGISDGNLCLILFAQVAPLGKLPFELGSSMEAIEGQKADVPPRQQVSAVPVRFWS